MYYACNACSHTILPHIDRLSIVSLPFIAELSITQWAAGGALVINYKLPLTGNFPCAGKIETQPGTLYV